MNQTIKPQRNITAIINEKQEKTDRNLNDCLVLKLANNETILVFPSKVKQIHWTDFKKGKRYLFTVEEGKEGTNVLINYQLNI